MFQFLIVQILAARRGANAMAESLAQADPAGYSPAVVQFPAIGVMASWLLSVCLTLIDPSTGRQYLSIFSKLIEIDG
jgi:hypothetical protein